MRNRFRKTIFPPTNPCGRCSKSPAGGRHNWGWRPAMSCARQSSEICRAESTDVVLILPSRATEMICRVRQKCRLYALGQFGHEIPLHNATDQGESSFFGSTRMDARLHITSAHASQIIPVTVLQARIPPRHDARETNE